MAQVYVSIGSNIDKEQNIRAGVADLKQPFEKVICSSVYESESVGFDGDNFYNLVAGFTTDKTPHEVSDILKQIENAHGRERTGPKFSSRTLDIDLLLYDDLVIDDGVITIPRDEILKNAFVLLPLAEIASALIHPQLCISYQQLWDEFDQNKQQLWTIEFVF
jgi:2-amino-4-hydroxy-6-hydroxymethyldihydropteridine diphosphokinase